MDLGRPDPGFGTSGEIPGCRPLEVGGRVADTCLWLDEDDAGGDDAGQEGEEGGVGTRGGAHVGGDEGGGGGCERRG